MVTRVAPMASLPTGSEIVVGPQVTFAAPGDAGTYEPTSLVAWPTSRSRTTAVALTVCASLHHTFTRTSGFAEV